MHCKLGLLGAGSRVARPWGVSDRPSCPAAHTRLGIQSTRRLLLPVRALGPCDPHGRLPVTRRLQARPVSPPETADSTEHDGLVVHPRRGLRPNSLPFRGRVQSRHVAEPHLADPVTPPVAAPTPAAVDVAGQTPRHGDALVPLSSCPEVGFWPRGGGAAAFQGSSVPFPTAAERPCVRTLTAPRPGPRLSFPGVFA